MPSATIRHHHAPPVVDYGLEAVAKHNADLSNHYFVENEDEVRGLDIYGDYTPFNQSAYPFTHSSPTPSSNPISEGIRSQSGCSTRLTDSPLSIGKGRVSKSPASRTKREKKRRLDKSNSSKLLKPLSVLTKDMEIPLRDIESYVHRSVEQRIQEMADKQYITRPMNSFMLYRSAYKDRTKQWYSQNNHQVISSVTGESWKIESKQVRDQFDHWAKIERKHHQEAHPDYKFSPSKANNKRRKGESPDVSAKASDLDPLSDAEYSFDRSVPQRRQNAREEHYTSSSNDSNSDLLYANSEMSGHVYQYADFGRTLPSDISYSNHDLSYHLQTNTHPTHGFCRHQQSSQHFNGHELGAALVSAPYSLTDQQSLGDFGLPGNQEAVRQAFSNCRTSTPMQYSQYGQPFDQRQQIQYQQPENTAMLNLSHFVPGSQIYEHQQYLQQASQPQIAIDPSLESIMRGGAVASSAHGGMLGESQFNDAMGDARCAVNLSELPDLYDYRSGSPTGVDATLAPTWSPSDLR